MASISYKIGGKYDPSAVTAAKTGFKGFDDVTKAFGVKANSGIRQIFGSFSKFGPKLFALGAAVGLVVGAVKKVAQAVQECEKKFAEAELSTVRLGMAVKNSTKLGSESFANLKKSAENFSKQSIYSADDITAQQAYLAGLNLTEEQINSTLQAAMNYSAYTGNDLKSSVETLAKTYTGAEGKLGNLGAEFKNLTDEQLKNGAAIDLVNQKYKDFSSVVANDTLSGREAKWKNTADDIGQSIGSVFGTLKYSILGKVQPIFDGFKDGLSTFNTGLINVFKNLPEVAQLTAQLVWEIFVTLLKPSTWISIIKSLLTTISKIFVDIWKGIGQLCVDVFNLVVNNVKGLFTNLGLGIKAIFVDAINLIIGAINKVLGIYNKIAGALHLKEVSEIAKIKEPEKITDAADVTKNTQNGLAKIATDYFGMIKNEGSDVKDLVVDIAGNFKDATKETTDKLGEILTRDTSTSDEAKSDTKGNTAPSKVTADNITVDSTGSNTEVQANSVTTTSTSTDNTSLSGQLGGISGIMDMLGEFGKTINLLMDGNPIGILVEVIQAFVGAFTSIENVNKSLNFLSTIFDSMKTVIEPLVNDVFSPFVVMFEDIGKMLGTILLPVFEIAKAILTPIMNVVLTIMNVLQPILTVVVQLLNMIISLNPWLNKLALVFNFFGNCITLLYNKILVPVVNGIIWIFTSCLNFIIGIWNKCVSALNSIEIMGWHPFDLDKKSGVNYDNLALKEIEAVTDSTTSTSSTSGSSGASYTASKDIVQNIYINDSYICGDAQKIALAIRAEIRQAEKLGY